MLKIKRSEIEHVGKEGDFDDSRCQRQSRYHRAEENEVVRAEGKYRMALRAHIVRMEYFRHGHCKESHCNSASLRVGKKGGVGKGGTRKLAAARHITDKVCGECQNCDKFSLLMMRRPARASHIPFTLRARPQLDNGHHTGLETERKRREAVGYKVNPEQVRSFENRKAEHGRRENRDDLAHV